MKEYKSKIEFNWWRDDDKKIPETHKDELEEHAFDRALEMRKQGFICGELLTEINNVQYSGWWEIKTK